MIRTLIVVASAAFVLAVGSPASATPTSGMKCNSCHAASAGHMTIVGGVLKNYDSHRLDKAKVGALPTFTIQRGHTLSIPVDVTNGGNFYAVTFEVRVNKGLWYKLTNHIAYTVGAKWLAVGTPVSYYTSSKTGTAWGGATKRYTIDFAIKATTPPDVYELFVVTAGASGGKWSQTQRIYVVVKP